MPSHTGYHRNGIKTREIVALSSKRPGLWKNVIFKMVTMVQLLSLVTLEGVITSTHHPGLQQVLRVVLLLLSVEESRHGREDYLTPSMYGLVSCRVCIYKVFLLWQ